MSNNKLIAEFMGGIYAGNTVRQEKYWHNIKSNKEYPNHKDLKFHKSWDWLMPVVEKILEITIEKDNFDTEDYYVILDRIPNLKEVYNEIVKFIKRYNNEPNNN